MMRRRLLRAHGFTLIELMIVLAVLAVVLTLAAPSFYDFILMQRLKAVSAQLSNDVQFTRSEATSRNQFVRMRFSSNTSESCYVIFTGNDWMACDCLAAPACTVGGSGSEIRTVKLPRAQGVSLAAGALTPAFRVDPSNGAIIIDHIGFSGTGGNTFSVDLSIDSARSLRTVVNLSGRPAVCAPAGSTVTGTPC